MIPHIFLDTNVWFSAFYGSNNCERLMMGFLEGKFDIVVSRMVLNELATNLNKKYPPGLIVFKKILENRTPKMVKDSDFILPDVKKYVHSKDQEIFQSALDAGVKIFITGNLKDFNVNSIYKKYKIKILSPKQAVDEVF